MDKKTSAIIKYFLLLVGFSVVISGCSSINYVEPKSGPVARVRFVTNMKSGTMVREYSSTSCGDEKALMWLREGFLLISEPRRLGIPLWDYHENAAKELLFSANVPHVFMFFSSTRKAEIINKCGVFLSQIFDEGKDYELFFKGLNGKCRVEVYEIRNNESGKAEKILLQKATTRVGPEFSDACLEKFKEKRYA